MKKLSLIIKVILDALFQFHINHTSNIEINIDWPV